MSPFTTTKSRCSSGQKKKEYNIKQPKIVPYTVHPDVLEQLAEARAKNLIEQRPYSARRRSKDKGYWAISNSFSLPVTRAKAPRSNSLPNRLGLILHRPKASPGSDSASEPLIMSRPASSTRPTQINLPHSSLSGRSPVSSPATTTSAAPLSPTSPRSSFLPSFIRSRSRAATMTGQRGGTSSPSQEVENPLSSVTSSPRGPLRDASTAPNLRDGGGVTRSVSTPATGMLAQTLSPGEFCFSLIPLGWGLQSTSRFRCNCSCGSACRWCTAEIPSYPPGSPP
jgi:hypothetical protein